MDAAIQEKVQTWLKGNYDEATKKEIKRYRLKTRKNWLMHFIRTLNLVPVALEALWV